MPFATILERSIAIRRDLHRHPELSWKEDRTARVVAEQLDQMGLSVRSCAAPGLLADIAGGTGPTVLLRADMDALPIEEQTGLEYASGTRGVMHACGHDGHVATLLAMAAWLMTHRARLAGSVRLAFQPAEEGGHGARAMIEAGALEGVDEVYGWHNMPSIPARRVACPDGPVMATNAGFRGRYRGRGGHASQPDECDDVVAAGAHFVMQVQTVVSRRTAPQEPVTVSVARIHAGCASNVMPDQIELGGTIRAVDDAQRTAVADLCRQAFLDVGRLHGVEAEFEVVPQYPTTINDPGAAARLRSAARACLGAQALTSHRIPMMTAEDFSYFLQQRPGAFMLLGSGRPGTVLAGCHSPHFDFDDELIPQVVAIWSHLLGLPAPHL